MESSSSTANTDNQQNNSNAAPPNPSEVNLDHLTQNPNYQSILRNIYSNNSNIPFIPGAFIMENFGYDTLLNPPNIHLKKTSPVTNDFHIDKSSLKLMKDEIEPNIYHVAFKFSAKCDGEAYIYFDAKEVLDDEKNISMIVYDQQPGYTTKPHIFNAGKGQNYDPTMNTIDMKLVIEEKFLKNDKDRFPVIIEMMNKTDNAPQKKKYYMYCVLTKDSHGHYGIKQLKQKFHFKGRTYELMNVYDVGLDDSKTDVVKEEKECAICLTNKIDTFVLPCNHLCLCSGCARDLKSHNNSKCPICRKTVETFLKLDKKKT